MIYYETLLLFFVLLTIVPFIVGLLIKNKSIRIFCWLMCIPFVGLTISTCNKHSSDNEKYTNQFLGKYKIDSQKSVYNGGDLTNYRNLTLTVNSNNTFVFNDSSMFLSKKGHWKFYSTEDGGYIRCIFPEMNYEIEVFVGDSLWGFQNGCFRNGTSGDIIYFRKEPH